MNSGNPDHTTPPSPTNTPQQHPIPSQFPSMTLDNLFPSSESTLLDAQITLVDPPPRTVDEVWREIVAGRREMKAEEEMMTLEDFLVKAGAAEEVKMESYGFDCNGSNALGGYESNGVIESGGGRGKRGRSASLMEPLDKAAAQRQRRMIKNRESAARSRERKQAYQIELESLATRLEEENERLLKDKEERTKERFKQLMEKVIPVVEKRRPPRLLRRVRSIEW